MKLIPKSPQKISHKWFAVKMNNKIAFSKAKLIENQNALKSDNEKLRIGIIDNQTDKP
jgi:hypothetical protein